MGSGLTGWLRSFLVERPSEPLDANAPAEWDVKPVPERIVAIGDLHGDVRALGAILTECRLLDDAGRWAGGAAHLVLLGDLLGGDRSRLLLDAVLRLEAEAPRAGGRVHTLLGNHDVLPVEGRFGKLSRAEQALFTTPPVPGAPGPELADAFRGESEYARWLRRRPAVLKIGATVFVHAGLDDWAEGIELGAVNGAVQAWIAHWQGVGPRPKKSTRVLVSERRGGDGPLWTRSFKGEAKDGPRRKVLRALLSAHGAKRLVIGHSPTSDGEVVLEHPRYGDAVVAIDTRISDARRGRLSALEIRGESLTAVYPEDRDAGRALEALAEAGLGTAPGSGPRTGASIWGRARAWVSERFGRDSRG